MMIGLMTPRRLAPAEGPEDVTAFPGRPLENISARGRYADKGDVSGTEGRRNVEALEDERGTVVAEPHGLQRTEKMTGLELEELPRLISRSKGLGDASTFSRPLETILVQNETRLILETQSLLSKDKAGEADIKVVDKTSLILGTHSVPGKGEADESDSKVVDEARLILGTQSLLSKDKAGEADNKVVDKTSLILGTQSVPGKGEADEAGEVDGKDVVKVRLILETQSMLFKDMAGKTDSKVFNETGPILGTQSVPGKGEADESDSKVIDKARLISKTQFMLSKDKAGKADKVDSKDVDEAQFLLETHSMLFKDKAGETILENTIDADGSEHSHARLQDFSNTAEPKIAVQKKERRSFLKQQSRMSRLVFVGLILLSLLGLVHSDPSASSHGWDFRNCATGQDVLDTGVDLGKTASPIYGPTCSVVDGISFDLKNDYVNFDERLRLSRTTSSAVATAIHMDGVSQGDAESAPQSLTTKDRGEALGVPPDTTVTLGTEPGHWTPPTSQTAIHTGGVSQGDVESAPQSLPAKDMGEMLGVPPDTTVTLGTEQGLWSTPTSQTAAAAAIHMDGISEGDVKSALQSLPTNDSQSLTTKEGGEALDVTLEGGSLSSEEKNSLGDVPKKINEPRNITTPTTATKELKSDSGPKNTRTPRTKIKKGLNSGNNAGDGRSTKSSEPRNIVTPPTMMITATTSTLCMATTRMPAPRTKAMVKVREGLLDGTTWSEIDHTDSPILAPTTGTWTQAMSNLHKEERKGTMLWSTAASSARTPNAAAFNPALTLKLISDMKESTTMAASTISAAATFDPALTSKMMSAMKESTTMTAGNAFRFEVAKILLQLCVSSNNMLQGLALTPSSATISTAANCTDFASPPPSTTKTAGMNTHDFEIEGLIECLDAELISTSNFTLKIDTPQAASFTVIITISDCGPLSRSTTMEIHGPEKEEVCITQTPLFFASIIFFVVVIITSALTFFESPFSGQSPGSNDLEVSHHDDFY
ncbi:hypothetical protein TrVE_jg9336 [Triparma verrucosa]|uniref:Uncharacterized protein n=1 Tax=Triparma verrucosa TaxID=1606542 RepID=A0A9W7FLF6_9STRA|nr:hypothetical protein TrVE_jg9336 [Triparma verrucosa]